MFVVFATVFSVMVITMLIMAVGVMFGRDPIKGSCGGLGAIGVEKACGCVDMCKNELPETSIESKTQAAPKVYHP